MSSILDSSKLIASIKRRAFIPRSQETFSNDDFLEMATEEINLGLVEQLIEARGDYLVYYKDVPLVEGTTAYTIPNRATGSKLRDASIIDQHGLVIYELSQITLEEVVDFQRDYTYQNRTNFYLRNDSVVLHEDMIKSTYSIRMWFYMRPNKLVQNSRGAVISISSGTVEVDNINAQSGSITAIGIGTEAVVTSTAHGLTEGKVVITGSDSTPSIDGTHVVKVIDANTFSVPVNVTVAGASGSWAKALNVYQVITANMPTHFSTDIKYDVVGAESPNKIIYYNLKPNSVNLTLKTISFAQADAPELLSKGDYITKAEETIVPNIPTEFHPIIAQRVAVACLEAMGDEQNKQSAERKLAQMERSALKIITNRVEGAPKKIKNRFGTLNSRKRKW